MILNIFKTTGFIMYLTRDQIFSHLNSEQNDICICIIFWNSRNNGKKLIFGQLVKHIGALLDHPALNSQLNHF